MTPSADDIGAVTGSLSAAHPESVSAWNPGVESGIPRPFRKLETIFRPECSSSGWAEVDELIGLTGLPAEELVAFRPERLALHEVIIRVTADIAVAEGEQEEVFGQNFRAITQRIIDRYITPQRDEIARMGDEVRRQVGQRVDEVLGATLFAPSSMAKPSLLGRLLAHSSRQARQARPSVGAASPAEREQEIIAGFRAAGLAADDALSRAVYRSLYRVLGAIQVRRGSVGGDRAMLAVLVGTDACNTLASQRIGERVASLVNAAIEQEGFVRVPRQPAPVLISLKGASAAGKSSLRPMIKQVMREQGIEADGYATISPDVWRRLLLDYEALGPAVKYAGHLTSRELMVIDGKLDRYIRARANHDQTLPHLLVDRFRFDSFASEKVARVLHDTYAHRVDTLLMYFIVTPPEETVERGWQRGLERGRYKAVEDFLGHSVEAYVGMPKIFFKWLAYQRPEYRYVFLDNRVPKGTFPKTIASGNQREMTIVDPLALIDIERYQKINLHARSRDEVYPSDRDFSLAGNTGFLRECLRRIPRVSFVDPVAGAEVARSIDGRLELFDETGLAGCSEACAEVLHLLAAR